MNDIYYNNSRGEKAEMIRKMYRTKYINTNKKKAYSRLAKSPVRLRGGSK